MNDTTTTSVNTITTGTSIIGDISANGDFRLDGTLKGNITLTGKLVVGEKGAVTGDIVCQNANIFGSIDGNLQVKEFLNVVLAHLGGFTAFGGVVARAEVALSEV